MKNFLEICKKYPLLLLLLATAAAFTAAGLAGKDTLYAAYRLEDVAEPSLGVVFRGIRDGVYPWEAFQGGSLPTSSSAVSNSAEEGGAEGTKPQEGQDSPAQEAEEPAPASPPASGDIPGNEAPSSPGSASEEAGQEGAASSGEAAAQEADIPVRSFTQVDESYFEDALFIGDSRTVGMMEYGGFSENTVFFAKTSLTIYDLFHYPLALPMADGSSQTLEELLAGRSFGKIYIMLGINELGRGTVESFAEEYRLALSSIHELQPDAVIFLQAIMHVGQEKDASDPIFNNANIQARNDALAQLADSRIIFWLDPNGTVCTPEGYLIPDYTSDQIHLKAQYYQLWKDYLMAHGIV